MRYLGGKTKLANRIAQAILDHTPRRGRYVEPFVGAGSVLMAVHGHFSEYLASDIHPDLIMLYHKIQEDGIDWMPDWVSREEWERLKNQPPSALRGLVGFGGSYGGRWFEGYARRRRGDDSSNTTGEAKRSFVQQMDSIMATEFSCLSYDEVDVRPGDVVYCDPPYAGRKGYSGTEEFDHDRFWKTAEEWSRTADVFVSEYEAPPGWKEIASIEHQVTMMIKGKSMVRDRLFTRLGDEAGSDHRDQIP